MLRSGKLSSDSSDTDEERKAISDALAEAAAVWRQRLSALDKAVSPGGKPGEVPSAQQKNLQASFDGANNGLRHLLADATDAGFSEAELTQITGFSANELRGIRKS